MKNEQYRKVIEEIIQCRFPQDKIAIIKNQIHSLADLEDVLLDAELTREEIRAVLGGLSLPEIASLAKKYPLKPDYETIYLREQERLLSISLRDFLVLLPEQHQVWISKVMDIIEEM